MARKKIFLGSSSATKKADDVARVRRLASAVLEKAIEYQDDGKPALPDSFSALFGNQAQLNAAARKDGELFRFASPGGALANREQLVLSVLSRGLDTPLVSTDGLKESILANIHCIATVENPAVAKKK